MRVKKQKQLRRHVSFYKTCFGFREPFKVLCDGTFVHYNLTQRLGALQDSLSTILGAPAKPLVTRCVIAELKKLGEAYSGSALAARRLDLIKYVLSWYWNWGSRFDAAFRVLDTGMRFPSFDTGIRVKL